MTAKQTAEKWGVTTRHVNELIRDGRIKGVYKVGAAWEMSDDTQKPIDLRLERKHQREKGKQKATERTKKSAKKQ